MYGNVATEMSHDRNGQTETARPNRPDRNGSDRNGSERIGQTETAQNESAIPKSRVHFLIFLKCVDVSERGRKGWARKKLSLRVWHELVRCIWRTKDLFLL